jgi:hypothetical protein
MWTTGSQGIRAIAFANVSRPTSLPDSRARESSPVVAIPADSDEPRSAVFAYLDQLTQAGTPHAHKRQLDEFTYEGSRLPLVDPQEGIRKPRGWSTVLSITSTRRSEEEGGCDDRIRDDGAVSHRMMGETTPRPRRPIAH